MITNALKQSSFQFIITVSLRIIIIVQNRVVYNLKHILIFSPNRRLYTLTRAIKLLTHIILNMTVINTILLSIINCIIIILNDYGFFILFGD